MSALIEALAARLPRDRGLRSFYLYLESSSGRETFTIRLGISPRVLAGEVPPAGFGLFVHDEDLRDLVEGFGDARVMLLDERLRIEGDLGAGMALIAALSELRKDR